MASVLFLFLIFGFCSVNAGVNEVDPHSYSRPWEVSVQHVDLDLSVDFKRKVLSGTATLRIQNKTQARTLHLDTKDMKIKTITTGGRKKIARYRLGQSAPEFGQELIVEIDPQTQSVTIEYETSPNASALQWLDPIQTADKRKPFLYTQSQQIHCRSWIPLQDTPSVRVTYSAKIRVPSELLALMSAENPTRKKRSGVYQFQMPQPIPSYLIALAVGDLRFKAFDRRSGIYAEPSVLKAAAWEFANTPRIIAAGEKIYQSPYLWDRYDILVLPPSFPYGGMENPRLTFATPTVIVGDRSQEVLIAHELSHSWTGNLVTNKNGSHFWLNEGFTVYGERRILEELYGLDRAEMHGQVEKKDLIDTMKDLPPELTKLRPNLEGVDPDTAYSSVPYEKGYLFLRRIESLVGRERFDRFLKEYIDEFKFRSIGTDDFLSFLESHLIKGDVTLRKDINASGWIDAPGLPKEAPEIHSKLLQQVDQQVEAWKANKPLDVKMIQKLSTFEWIHLLDALPTDNPQKKLAEFDTQFSLTQSQNAEILTLWLKLGLMNHYPPALTRVAEFLVSVGRGKFVYPLYLALAESGHRDLAIQIFRKASPGYHPITRVGVIRKLNLTPAECEGSLH